MKNGIIRFFVVVMLISLFAVSLPAYADEPCNMTLTYTKDQNLFPDLVIDIYYIADQDLDKLSPYDSYPVEVKDITSQAEWNDIASTLGSYIIADNIVPYMSLTTDSEGKVCFEGIDKGLYLVAGVNGIKGGDEYFFYDFMIFVSEDVDAEPKSITMGSNGGDTEFRILKLWKDGSAADRPLHVTVDIFKDGVLYKTVALESINNWSCSFVGEGNSVWSVAERDVDKDYYVTITEKEATFIITNTAYDDPPDDDTPDDDISAGSDTTTPGGSDTTTPGGGSTTKPDPKPPQTGDVNHLKRYTVLLCISGMMLIILGFGMRRKDNAKSR